MTFLRHSHGEDETTIIGQEIAVILSRAEQPVCIALHGNLGAGKSSLARAIIRTLMSDPNLDVPSPTFTIVQEYQPEKLEIPLFHFDLYRLEEPEELLTIGAEDYFADGHCLIEWPEKAGTMLPRNTWHLTIDLIDGQPNERIIQSEHFDG